MMRESDQQKKVCSAVQPLNSRVADADAIHKSSGRFDDSMPSWRNKNLASENSPSPPTDIPFAQDGEAAYLRRLAMSTRPGATPLVSPSFAPASAAALTSLPPASIPPPAAMSGEEAYQRRLAMSAGVVPQPMPPAFESLPAQTPPPAFVPPIRVDSNLPTAFIPPGPSPESLAAEIQAKRNAAAAIAARLSQMAQLAPAPPSGLSGDNGVSKESQIDSEEYV